MEFRRKKSGNREKCKKIELEVKNNNEIRILEIRITEYRNTDYRILN
jgi:hypothetical protein